MIFSADTAGQTPPAKGYGLHKRGCQKGQQMCHVAQQNYAQKQNNNEFICFN